MHTVPLQNMTWVQIPLPVTHWQSSRATIPMASMKQKKKRKLYIKRGFCANDKPANNASIKTLFLYGLISYIGKANSVLTQGYNQTIEISFMTWDVQGLSLFSSVTATKQEVSLHIHYTFNIKMYKCGAVSLLHIMCKSSMGNAEEYDNPYELVTAALWFRQPQVF